MKRFLAGWMLVVALVAPLSLWAACPIPNINNPNAVTIQGPGPDGGYPIPVTTNTGCPLDVTSSGGLSACVTQCTSPWVVSGTVTANSGNPGTDRTSGPTTFVASGTISINVQGCEGASIGIKAGGGGWTGSVSFQAVSPNGDIENLLTNFPTLGIYQASVSSASFPAGVYNRGWATCGTDNVIQANVVVSAGSVIVDLEASSSGVLPVQIPPQTGAAQLPSMGIYGRDAVSNSWNAPSVQRGIATTTSTGQSYLYCLSDPYLYTGGAGGNIVSVARTPAIFNTVATAAAGNTALWTPAAGKKFRLMRYMVTIVDQATQAAPGTVTVSLFDGAAGATGQVHDVFVPALGLVNNGSLYTSGWIDLGNGYLSTAANNVLNINLSAALTAGTVRVICAGTEE